ncbi:hypothetical protein DE146DRAFT_306746 [Phaeosphaeria sp. MPI-PUGE-AT-0046c]|nr:hypothetical protein DE146DRAFT_306746 [Phaeosphaeria sp. MPI-PUGE-AT-0046c]
MSLSQLPITGMAGLLGFFCGASSYRTIYITLQPLACPAFESSPAAGARNCTSSPIGFVVIDASKAKSHFRGREFFKLARIELRCEVLPNNTIVVEPREDTAPDLLIIDNSDSSSPAHSDSATDGTMEIDSRPSISRYSMPRPSDAEEQHERHQIHHPRGIEVIRESLPPLSTIRSSNAPSPLAIVSTKSPNIPLPSVSPRPIQPLRREPSSGSANRGDFATNTAQLRSPHEGQSLNGITFPRPPGEVSLDAIERLQTQISQNSGALAAHTRDIRRGEESFQQLETNLRREFATQLQCQTLDVQRVDESVARLHLEMQGMRQALETISHELALCRSDIQRGVSGQAAGPPDAALELMAQQVAHMSHRTSEVDNLRVTVEIMKKKIHVLEQGSRAAKPVSTLPASIHAPPPHGPTPPQSQPRDISQQIPPAPQPRKTPPLPAPSNPVMFQTYNTAASSATPDIPHGSSQSNGWSSVNAGTKRAHLTGVESPRDSAMYTPGSPKRQRLATTDPVHIKDGDTDHSGSLHPNPPILPTQTSTAEPVSTPQAQHWESAPYGTPSGPSEDGWRPESQRSIEHRPRGRGRGRGGGPGSRGGRVRQSLPAQVHQSGPPVWDREDWHGDSESHTGLDGYYSHVARSGRGIARRGSGGGGRGGYAQSERAGSLGSQGVSPGFSMGSPNDPYAHTKKTRTKPIRNADGVLIRKDGRPDMRSQSSAANLRKVHARKEGEISAQGSPTGFTPVNLAHATSADDPDTPSPSGYAHPDPQAPSSVQRKHTAIMGKMFPSGVDESRRQNDYAHQVFEEDRDHIARVHGSREPAESMIRIKKEAVERTELVRDSQHDNNVDTNHTANDDHADNEQQTPVQRTKQMDNVSVGEQSKAQSASDIPRDVIPETQAIA